ncbi:TspO/MBR family protein [Lichenihabitans psoromatis]|uniref:TspO/MBR family protein n=1 Tax=Lichenihabitans psoromatis TaxID=2528642 RepID=UPI00103833B9|nr:TspO/MBR family protein [Lichenihabitans psoromatis]
MSSIPSRSGPGTISTSLAAIAPVVTAFLLGNLATFPNLPWYETLTKPAFNPPNWLFGPAWTLLYILMAVAFFRILRLPPATRGRSAAVISFLVQITLNAAWSWAFFAGHNPRVGLIVVVALVVAVAVTMVLFFRLDRIAGLCFVPYLAWVSFATALNGAILTLNG